MVAAGLGVTLIPQLALALEQRVERDLACVPLAPPGFARTIALAWRPTSPREEDFVLLGETVAEVGSALL